MVMEVRLEQSANARCPMDVTPSGMVMEVAQVLHFTAALFLMSKPSLVSSSPMIASQLSLFVSADRLIKASFAKKQSSKAPFPILVTLSGMVMEVSLMQYRKA